jgi:cytochrome P450
LVYNVYFHPLAAFPGPKLYGATLWPSMLQSIKGNVVFDWTKLHEEYGPVVRVGPSELSYTTAQAWIDIYGSRPGKGQMPKYKVTHIEGFGAANMVNSTPEDHSRHRKLLSHAFSDKAMRAQEPLISEYIDLLMLRLKERLDQSLDLTKWFNLTTFDITGDLTFGEPFDGLKNAEYNPWITLIFSNLKMMVFGNVSAEIPGMTTLLYQFAPKQLIEESKAHITLTQEKALKRMKMESKRQDLMSYILNNNDDKNGLSVNEIQADAYVMIIGGSETTATLLSGAIFYLCQNPEAMEKLVAEVRSSFNTESHIDFNGVSKLPYLLAVLQESLRMYPPVPGNMPREVPSEGAIIDGRFVPGGTGVSVCQWASYRSERNFKDANHFHPERWLGHDPQYANDQRDVFQPFSFGPRNCIGRNLAYMEMRLILARLIWNFEIELCKESEGWNLQKTFILWEKPELNVRLKLRTA